LVVTQVHDNRDEIEAIELQLLEVLADQGYPESSHFAIRLALHEAIVNAFVHGHKGLSEDLPVDVGYDVSPERVRLSIRDRGPGFQPSDVPDPTLDENLTKPSGRGLMLMRAYMTEVSHTPPGNELVMVYKRPANAN
jgi:serine/threonine-protein kinase RsbW